MRGFWIALLFAFTSSAAAGSERFGLRAGARFEARDYESHLGSHGVDQRLLRADALWDASPSLRIESSIEALDNEVSAGTVGGQWGPIVSLGGAVRLRLLSGRAAIAAGGTVSLAAAGLTAEEAATASELDGVGLELLRPSPRRGGGPFVSAAATVVQRGAWRVHAAFAEEWALEHALLDVGSDVAPSERTRLALEIGHTSGVLTSRLTLRAVRGVESAIDGKAAYETGDEFAVALHTERTHAGGALFVDVGALARAHGESLGAELDASLYDTRVLRGGNQSRASLGWRRGLRSDRWLLALDSSITRGFSGHVGHATAMGPRLGYSRPLGGLRLACEGRLFWGEGRAGRSLEGAGFGLSISHGRLR